MPLLRLLLPLACLAVVRPALATIRPVNVSMNHFVNITFAELSLNGTNLKVQIADFNSDVVSARLYGAEATVTNATATATVPDPSGIEIRGIFLGRTNVTLRLSDADDAGRAREIHIPVAVLVQKTSLDKAFTISLVIALSIIYVNFGCAIDKQVVIDNLKRPIGPLIGIFCQYTIMPILGFAIGHFLLEDKYVFRLGLFFTGVSPAGGGSNVWTCLLNGNVNLSITMTTLSTFAAFVMIPFWLFTLGKPIFRLNNIVIPYTRILKNILGLVVPLLIGVWFQRLFPKLSRFLSRILKCFSSILILFIIVFAIVTKYHLFKLFTWNIVLAGMCLSWLGYLLGFAVAVLFKESFENALTIAIETGVQNTGISIYMLIETLREPESEIASVIPCAVALATPVPLFVIYVTRKIQCRFRSQSYLTAVDKSTKESCIFDVKNRY